MNARTRRSFLEAIRQIESCASGRVDRAAPRAMATAKRRRRSLLGKQARIKLRAALPQSWSAPRNRFVIARGATRSTALAIFQSVPPNGARQWTDFGGGQSFRSGTPGRACERSRDVTHFKFIDSAPDFE